MKSYKIDTYNGHILLNLNGIYAIIDTGSPISISNQTLEFLNKRYKLPDSFMGIKVNQISELAGFRIDAIIGNDILSKYKFKIRFKDRFIDFGDEIEHGNIKHNIIGITSIIFNVTIDNRNTYAILDTGAFISYACKELVANKTNIGKKEDFYPIIGKFKTPLFELPTSIDNRSVINLHYGILPKNLEYLYDSFKSMTCTEAIIGTQIFEKYNCIISWKDNLISWEELA